MAITGFEPVTRTFSGCRSTVLSYIAVVCISLSMGLRNLICRGLFPPLELRVMFPTSSKRSTGDFMTYTMTAGHIAFEVMKKVDRNGELDQEFPEHRREEVVRRRIGPQPTHIMYWKHTIMIAQYESGSDGNRTRYTRFKRPALFQSSFTPKGAATVLIRGQRLCQRTLRAHTTDGEGFEPPMVSPILVFETSAFGRSANHP